MAVLIISLTLVASLGAMGAALRLSDRAEETTRAVLEIENLLFELETGARADLLQYGGKGKWGDYEYEIRNQTTKIEKTDFNFYDLALRLGWNLGRDFLSLETFLKEGWLA